MTDDAPKERRRRPRELTERLGLRVTPELRAALEERARREGRSLSGFAVRVLSREVGMLQEPPA